MWYATRAVVQGYEEEVVVNMDRVRYIAPDHDEPAKTLLVFDNDSHLTVHASYATLALYVVGSWRPSP